MNEDELNEELDDGIIRLNDENGEEVKFYFLDLIEYENERYVVLLPTEEHDDDESDGDAGEVVILKVEHLNLEDPDDEEESYTSVDDEETLSKVFDLFKEKHKDEFDFID